MAMQGFTYTLSWGTDFTEVDNQPAGFTDRSARTKANVTLDPGMQGKRDAGTSVYYFAPATVIVIIKASKADSWVLKDKKTDKLLKHEQMHYNISALGGRDLERKLIAIKESSAADLMAQKASLSTEIQALIDKTNKQYDDDLLGTKHGTKDAEQSKWELHISNLMNNPSAELKGI
jgi:hypothetical protein